MKKNPVGILGDHYCAYPDPYVLRWRNQYYCYSTGEKGIHILVSDDLVEFHDLGYAYANEKEHSYWAPAVFYWKGKFYLYYSSLLEDEKDDHQHFLRVAVAENPMGPYTLVKTLTDYFAIDPHVVSNNGKIYIFYAANIFENEINGRIGTAIWIDELLTPDKMAGKGRTVLIPTIDQEIFQRNRFGDGKDWHTLEGPFYLSDGETGWLMYSGNAYISSDYFIGYAQGNISEEFISTQFEKKPSANTYQPLVRSGNGIEGTGHNSVTQAPDHITPVIVYHGREQGHIDDGQDHRRIYTDFLYREKNDLLVKTTLPCTENTWLRPDVDLLEKVYSDMDDTLKLGGPVYKKFSIPSKDILYLELCILPEKEVHIIMGNKDILTIQSGESYWHRIGLLMRKGLLNIRLEEEWKKVQECDSASVITIKTEGDITFEYFDCTFLQTGQDGIPGCLL